MKLSTIQEVNAYYEGYRNALFDMKEHIIIWQHYKEALERSYAEQERDVHEIHQAKPR